MSDEEQIKELYRTYWQYMIDKNADGLRKIMSSDYYLRHMTGVKQSVDEFLKGLLNGPSIIILRSTMRLQSR